MVRETPSSAPEAQPAYRVEVPRASDPIRHALVDAYSGDNALPEDMAYLLRRLNQLDIH